MFPLQILTRLGKFPTLALGFGFGSTVIEALDQY